MKCSQCIELRSQHRYWELPLSKRITAVGASESVKEDEDSTDGNQSTDVEDPDHSDRAHEPAAKDRCEETPGPPDEVTDTEASGNTTRLVAATLVGE